MRLCIFDIDGTLVCTKSGATFRKTADDWQWLPGRLEKLQALREQGTLIACATNQGGVAFGYMQEDDVFLALLDCCNQGHIDTLRVCYTHPTATIDKYRAEDSRRKPGPGMLQEIMHQLDVLPDETLFVGDRGEDNEAAQAAGVEFVHADEYFAQEKKKSQ